MPGTELSPAMSLSIPYGSGQFFKNFEVQFEIRLVSDVLFLIRLVDDHPNEFFLRDVLIDQRDGNRYIKKNG